MRVAIMQPYFFPYLGYFDLLHNVDLFVIYDTVQYIRRGWIHRNRILHQRKNGWQYIIVPTEPAPQKTPICDVRIKKSLPWQENMLGQLEHYRKIAPHAEQISHFVKDCLFNQETFISQLNVQILAFCSRLMNLNFQYQLCSSLNIELDRERNAEERILDLCEFLDAKEYVNLPGGVDLYHPEAFESRNIKLTFRNLPPFIYSTAQYDFEPNLSIIDVLMWNKPEDIKKYLDHYKDNS
jgi:hypothetical protein